MLFLFLIFFSFIAPSWGKNCDFLMKIRPKQKCFPEVPKQVLDRRKGDGLKVST